MFFIKHVLCVCFLFSTVFKISKLSIRKIINIHARYNRNCSMTYSIVRIVEGFFVFFFPLHQIILYCLTTIEEIPKQH